MRKGSANTQRGVKRFIEELVPRLRRAGATVEIVVRVDSGFWSKETIAVLGRLGVRYTMAVRTGTKALASAIAGIAEDDWTEIDYPEGGRAAVAETTYQGRRLVVRRTRLVGPQAQLWPDWRHFAFLTDLTASAVEVDAFHRERAQAELDIRDLKVGAGMEHCPSGSFFANAAWLSCAVLAHNRLRWTQLLGGLHDRDSHRPAVARTIRTRFVSLPGRLVNRSGTPTLRAPSHWPWQEPFTRALWNLRALAIAVT